MIAVSWFGGRQIIAGSMLTGEFFSFLSYLMPTHFFDDDFHGLCRIGYGAGLGSPHHQVMDEPLDITDAGSADVSVADGSVDFENVSFSYAKKGDNLTLENINLHIRSGETIGIIGGTGSAKQRWFS